MNSIKEIVVDASAVNNNPACAYRGLGAISANNSSRLLIDYKAKNPEAYWEIMNLLFKKNYGAGLTHVKIELGGDINSSSGTEPCTKRYEDEMADVTRGAGFVFASDAKKINSDITIDCLRWGEPGFIKKAYDKSVEDGLAARYKWYKETIDAAFDTYGLKFDYISGDGNETGEADAKWLIYLSEHLKNEKNKRYDYSKIKIVASDEVGTRNIALQMTENEELRNAVDIVALHYTTYGDENTKLLNEKYGKEIWYSEGIAPCNVSEYSVNADGNGISGINSVIDVTNRIINAYYHGKMVHYEYQPAVAAYYTGSNYAPKQLITAEQPWSGHYEIGSGLFGAAHITHFTEKGWRFVDSGCFGDGEENHYITDTTANYMTLMSDEGDYTIVLTNDSDKPRRYNVCVRNTAKSDCDVHCIETKGPEKGAPYNENWFRVTDKIIPVKKTYGYVYTIDVKPFSIMTCTTMSVEHVNGIDTIKKCAFAGAYLRLPYTDSFNYPDEFIKTRGGAPLYTTDQGGAFEVDSFNGENVLIQKITKDIIPVNWRFRNTPFPVCSLGDDKWTDYTMKAEVMFEKASADNYIGIGVRYNSAVTCDYTAECGYQLRIFPDCKCQLKYMDKVIEEGFSENISIDEWNLLELSADGNVICAYINGEKVFEYKASVPMITSGRVSFYSAHYKNKFRNLNISPIYGQKAYARRIDCLSGLFEYSDGWTKNAMDSFKFYNRTSVLADDKEYFTFEFTGDRFSLMGEAEELRLKIELDDKILAAGLLVKNCDSKQVFYFKSGLTDEKHKVRVTVLSGSLKFDSLEIPYEAKETGVILKRSLPVAVRHTSNKKNKKLRKSTVFLGAGIAMAGAGIFMIIKKIKKNSDKR